MNSKTILGVLVGCVMFVITASATMAASTYVQTLSSSVTLIGADVPFTILTFSVPAGKWIGSSVVQVEDSSGTANGVAIVCILEVGGIGQQGMTVGGALTGGVAQIYALPLQAVFTTTGTATTVRLLCKQFAGVPAVTINAGTNLIVQPAGKIIVK